MGTVVYGRRVGRRKRGKREKKSIRKWGEHPPDGGLWSHLRPRCRHVLLKKSEKIVQLREQFQEREISVE